MTTIVPDQLSQLAIIFNTFSNNSSSKSNIYEGNGAYLIQKKIFSWLGGFVGNWLTKYW